MSRLLLNPPSAQVQEGETEDLGRLARLDLKVPVAVGPLVAVVVVLLAAVAAVQEVVVAVGPEVEAGVVEVEAGAEV